jgi:phosphate transport system substrate-binding protein
MNAKYFTKTTIMALIAMPVIVGIGGITMLFTMGFGLLLSPLVVAAVWTWYIRRQAKRETLPENLSQTLLPIFISFAYYMSMWVLLFGIAGYSYDTMTNSFFPSLFFLTLPYFGASFIFAFIGLWWAFPIKYGLVTLAMLIPTLIICRRKISLSRQMLMLIVCMIALAGISAFQFYARSSRFVGRVGDTQVVRDDIDTFRYRPFSDDNYLVEMPSEPTITFTENFPRLDGATAAYPVYAAIAQALFVGLDAETVREFVSVSRTDVAYERLIRGEIDIFFGAQPSPQQIAAAQAHGVEFTMTPIAREAFVFFVHSDNPVESLTVSQIQNIYRRRLTNWRRAGGRNERILPFQRSANSGSQTIMEAVVMDGLTMAQPLQHEWIGGMGEAVASVAIYRNYSSAIGYSFRYFVTGMRPHDEIRLLAVDGISPTPENIRNGTYPFTVNVYAVTAGTTNENARKLIEWILSEQGQTFIELCGIVSVGYSPREIPSEEISSSAEIIPEDAAPWQPAVISCGDNFRIVHLEPRLYSYKIFSTDGELVFENSTHRPASIHHVCDDILEHVENAGTSAVWSRYYSVGDDMLSDNFYHAFYLEDRLVALVDFYKSSSVIVVRDIFDAEIFHREFYIGNCADPSAVPCFSVAYMGGDEIRLSCGWHETECDRNVIIDIMLAHAQNEGGT